MRQITFAKAINEAIREEMTNNSKVFFMGEDIGLYHKGNGPCGVSTGLMDQFGEERVIETPIGESVIVGAGVGAAMCGLRPIIEIMHAEFICCAFEHVVYGGCKAAVKGNGKEFPLLIRTQFGGTQQGSISHDDSIESWFNNVPGLKIVIPSNTYDAKGLLKASIRDNYPVLFLEHKALYKMEGEVPEEDYIVPLCKASVPCKGDDVTIITYGNMVHKAFGAARELKNNNINIEVIDLRTVLPLDEETILTSIKKSGKVIIFHEDRKTGGLGGEISAIIAEKAFSDLKAPILRVAGPDVPANYPCTEDDLIVAVEQIMKY